MTDCQEKMKDFRGRELSVGDKVIYIPRTTGHYATGFQEATIVGFTPKRVRVSHKNWKDQEVGKLVPPEYCIKIDD